MGSPTCSYIHVLPSEASAAFIPPPQKHAVDGCPGATKDAMAGVLARSGAKDLVSLRGRSLGRSCDHCEQRRRPQIMRNTMSQNVAYCRPDTKQHYFKDAYVLTWTSQYAHIPHPRFY